MFQLLLQMQTLFVFAITPLLIQPFRDNMSLLDEKVSGLKQFMASLSLDARGTNLTFPNNFRFFNTWA